MIIITENEKYFRPCSCCGETDVQWEEFEFPAGERVARKCRYCGMQTGWHKTDAEARAQWNTRFDIDELEALYLEEHDKDELGDIDCGDDVRNFLAWCRNNISKSD